MKSDARELLNLTAVTKKYDDFVALHGIDLTVREGEIVVIVGSSGSGKSTLIRCINQLELIQSGEIAYEGRPLGIEMRGGKRYRASERQIMEERQKFGMVFQSFNLFPHMTVLENVITGPRYVLHQRSGEYRPRAISLIERVGLSDKLDRYPNQLSGGQQQRVAIARALAMQPKIMLFDEPTSALDPELVNEVLQVIKDVAVEGMTMIVVTHEMRFARQIADTLVYMDSGRIIESGPPEAVMDNPATIRAKTFFQTSGV